MAFQQLDLPFYAVPRSELPLVTGSSGDEEVAEGTRERSTPNEGKRRLTRRAAKAG